MTDTKTDLPDSIPTLSSTMMEQAKESICRIEESATRIHSIVNGATKPNVVRTNTRRRDDYKVDYIKHWLIVAVVALIASLGCMTTYMWYEMHTTSAISSLSIRISGLESQITQLSRSLSIPLQNSSSKQ